MPAPAETPASVFEVSYPVTVAAVDQEEFIEMEVILDSGAGAHVASKRHIPGYDVVESELQRSGAAFVAADGGRIDNEGEAALNLVTVDAEGAAHEVASTFQIADVTRPLWSVGVICDSGLNVVFAKDHAKVLDAKGVELCHFARRNGLYIAKVRLRNPKYEGFRRQGQ